MAEAEAKDTQVDDARYIEKNEQEINEFFKQMQFKVKDFDLAPEGEAQTQPVQQLPKQVKQKLMEKQKNQYRNYRGQIVVPIQKLRENYEKAMPGAKWLTLPYCRRTIFGKIQFWCGASFIFTYMWGTYYMRKHNLTSLSFKQYRNAYGLFALASSLYVFTESIFFEPYCDINSYHYRANDNLFVAKDIKKQLRELK